MDVKILALDSIRTTGQRHSFFQGQWGERGAGASALKCQCRRRWKGSLPYVLLSKFVAPTESAF